MRVRVHVCMHAQICVCMGVRTHVCVCVCVCVDVCVWMCALRPTDLAPPLLAGFVTSNVEDVVCEQCSHFLHQRVQNLVPGKPSIVLLFSIIRHLKKTKKAKHILKRSLLN